MSLVGLLETRVKHQSIDKVTALIASSWSWVHNGQFHNRVRLLIGWDPSLLDVIVTHCHLQCMLCKVTVKHSRKVSWF